MRKRKLHVTKEQHRNLEHYYFNLATFINSREYRDLSSLQQNKIQTELNYIWTSLNVLSQIYEPDKKEKRIVGWVNDPTDIISYRVHYHFSCAEVAGKCMNCKPSSIISVCEGYLGTTGGNITPIKQKDGTITNELLNSCSFKFEDDYEKNADISFDINKDKLTRKNYG